MTRPSANEAPTVEVVTEIQRRRWSIDEKLRMVEESDLPGMTVSYVARKNGVAPSLLFRWRKLMKKGGKVAVQAGDDVVSVAEARVLKKRIRDLERLLGKKTMEVEILKDALELAREKKLISRSALPFKEDIP
ncbi:MAG: transposase [Desulfovibrionales bacterium]|jgi:transposase|nr:transposase [Desulfovibrionales bacterium]